MRCRKQIMRVWLVWSHSSCSSKVVLCLGANLIKITFKLLTITMALYFWIKIVFFERETFSFKNSVLFLSSLSCRSPLFFIFVRWRFFAFMSLQNRNAGADRDDHSDNTINEKIERYRTSHTNWRTNSIAVSLSFAANENPYLLSSSSLYFFNLFKHWEDRL